MVDIEDVRRIPVIGSKLYRVGQVQEIITQPCSPDPEIAVKAFFANVPMLIWSFVKPEPIDSTSERFGQGHHRKRKGKFIIDDIMIGQPGDGKGYLRWVSFTGQKLLQRVGFYFAVLDATTDFLINWTSMAYRFSGCQDPTSGYATDTLAGTAQGFVDSPTGFHLAGNQQSFSPGFLAAAGGVQMQAPGPYALTASVTILPGNTLPRATVTRIELRDTQDASNTRDLNLTPGESAGVYSGSTVIRSYGPGVTGHTFQLWAHGAGGFFDYTNYRLSLSGWPQGGIEPDP